MAGVSDIPGIEIHGKGRGEYRLPCGWVSEDGKVHKRIIFREMTGVEEDMMDDEDVPRVQRVTDVLSACCTQVGDVTDKDEIRRVIADDMRAGKGITSTDRIACLIFLRRVSVGDLYHFERRCPRCGHMNKNRKVDLRKLEMKEVPEERVGKRRVEVDLPRSGLKCVLRVMTAKNEDDILQLRPTQKDLRTAAMAARVEQIGDRRFTSSADTMQALKDLPQRDRVYIRKVYDLMEADVDTRVEVQCDSPICLAEYDFPMDLGQAFFSNTEGVGVTEKELKWL